MEFVESFMQFSFRDEDIFRIEEDELVKETEGVKACECVVLISEEIAFIEAKASSPRIENEAKFQVFISDIRQKFADSLRLFSEIKSKARGEEAFLHLPSGLQNSQAATATYKIYLIIHGHLLDWLTGLTDVLRQEMKEVVKEWNIRDSNVKVFNEESALENNLIVAYVPVSDIAALKLSDGTPDPVKVQQWFDEHKDASESE